MDHMDRTLTGSMSRHPAGKDLPSTYRDYARSLRALAAVFDSLSAALPLPQYPEQGIEIDIHVAYATDVVQAGRALNSEVKGGAHTTTGRDIGTVRLRYVHVSDEAYAAYNARQSYSQNLQVTS